MHFDQRSIVVLDFETTGLDPRRHDVIEIGAIRVDQKTLLEQARFERKVKIQHPETVQPAALQINGYNTPAWALAWDLPDAMREFSDFAASGIIAAWNITFEYGFLSEAFTRSGLPDTTDYHRIDIPSLAWLRLGPMEHFSQNDVASALGLPEEPVPHRAIAGAEYAWSILRKLKGFDDEQRPRLGNLGY